MNSNIERWRYYLKDLESPDLFIDWAWYSTIAAVLQRRVSFGGEPFSSEFQVYPNMYAIFIGPPGVGKSIAASKAKAIVNAVNERLINLGWAKDKPIKIGPQTVSLPALITFIGNNFTVNRIQRTEPITYHHCSVSLFISDELENLLSSDSGDIVSFLNTAWDCGSFFKLTKTQGVDVLHNMCLNMLGCATQEWVSSSAATKVLKGGFAARSVFVYGGLKRKLVPFIRLTDEQRQEFNNLVNHLCNISGVTGEIKMTTESEKWFMDYYEKSPFYRINHDRKLDYYYERRKIHLIKLAINMHFSEKTNLILDLEDLQKANELLERTERNMHLALMYSNRNALSSTAAEIAMYIRESNRPIPDREILERFFSVANTNEIKTVMNYLTETKQIMVKRMGPEICYEYLKREENNDNSNRN